MTFLTGRHLSRRTFLRGAGATVALPFLDAMVPAGRAGTAVPDATRVVVLATSPTEPVHVASQATATASSQRVGQEASKAIDGVWDGHPGDLTREWATNKQKVGAWIQLTWSSPQTVTRVVLYDRMNTKDQATGGTLSFSDGVHSWP